jgi:chain length determinant protein tyrosine kinase EpsG
MTIQQFLNILRARWGIVASIFVLVVGAALAVSLSMPKKYTATAQVLVDVKSPDPILGMLLPGQMAPGYMATQVDIASSPRVALGVVDQLRIADNPTAVEKWREETGGSGSIRHHYAELLLKSLDVKPSRESSVLNIAYTSSDPQFVAMVANAFAQAYIGATVDIKVEPARQTRGFFDTQTGSLRDRLEEAQRRLSSYQREKGIISADERLDVENARLLELSSQLTAVQAQLVEASKRRQIAQDALQAGKPQDVPEVLGSALIQQLKVDVARLESKIREQEAAYGTNYPAIVKMREEVASLRQRIEMEMSTVVTSLGKQYQLMRSREDELRGSLERQRAKVLQIKQVRDELAVLQRDVENAQKAFDGAAQRLAQTSLESQSTQSNVVLLNAAVEPARPASPNIPRNVALGVFTGALLGVAAAMLAELRKRRIRSTDDLAQSSGLPVIGYVRRLSRRMKNAPRLANGQQDRSGLALESIGNTVIVDPSGPWPPTAAAGFAVPAPAAPSTYLEQTPRRRKKRLGEILTEAGLLKPGDLEPVLAIAGEANIRFGEAAIRTHKVTETQVRQALAFQFDFPVLLPGASPVSAEVVTAYEARHPLVADLRKLRTQVLSRWLRSDEAEWPPRKAVAVVSPNRGDGKSFVAANLAVTFSQMGEKTLLIDADMRNGRLHEMFGMDNRVGLTALLNNQEPLGALKRVEGLRDLTLISSGSEAPNPSDLLSREVFEFLLASFSKDYDVIIVDTPNASDEPDAQLVARCAKAAVVLGRTGRSGFDATGALADELRALGVEVLGAVFVDA